MHGQMPQEIEVWYIIPALRRQIAFAMKSKLGVSQKIIAQKMGVTEAAVSQYLNAKRAGDIEFNQAVLDEISKSAQRVIEKDSPIVSEMMMLCNLPDVKKVLCDLHKKQDQSLASDCNSCFEPELIQVNTK